MTDEIKIIKNKDNDLKIQELVKDEENKEVKLEYFTE